MSDPLHIVCPHCNTTNRVPNERLNDQPTCGKCHGALFEGRPTELDEAGFDRHTAHNDIPVVVDFWAAWCGPCKMMAPEFAKAAAQLEPHVRFVKVNTDDQQNLGQRFNVRSIPMLALFKNGREIARQAGAMNAVGIVQWVRANS